MRPVILILLASCLLPSFAQAQGEGSYGVAPSEVRFGSVVRDEPLYRAISIQNSKDHPVQVELRPDGELGGWALPAEANFTIPARSTRDVDLPLRIPADAPNGNYSGGVYVHFLPESSVASGTSGARLAFAVRVNLSAHLGGPQTVAFEAGGLWLRDIEEASAPTFHWQIKNVGNVRAAPTVDVAIRRADGSIVARESLVGDTLAPGLLQNVTFRTSTPLARGQYTLTASFESPSGATKQELQWFEALEAGSLRRSGTLEGLTLHDVGTGEQTHRIPASHAVELRAPFTNTGQLAVKAKLQGYVARDGQVVADLRSAEVLVDPGETTELRILLPKLSGAGQYQISAEVAYSGKITPAQEAILILEAAPPGSDGVRATPAAGAALGLVALAVCAAFWPRRR